MRRGNYRATGAEDFNVLVIPFYGSIIGVNRGGGGGGCFTLTLTFEHVSPHDFS